MKKITAISTLALAVMAASPAFAADTQWFVGGGVGYQEDNVKGANAQNGEDATYQLRGGAIMNDHHRVMGTYSYMDKSSQNMFLASYDYLMPVHQNVNLFAGVSAGVADNKISGSSSTDFVWGGQVGAMYEINDNWSTDLTYRYLDQDYSKNDTKIDYSQQVVWSVDYRF
ncbi:porin family protein [Photobacterium sp. BZF1]|uniref:Porin family protein n=1 Tax=Photobacterium rosenbergii TaxID=294936 RepID=A0A2T3N908_9GAMM|nr:MULTISPECIES: porin family protein [Photobacterium]MBC7001302.1 porin family protein [Photobacterium sp. BZF1]MBY5944954.1 porin family protein [Photobacterium rosenbergii]PSW09836.1 porin family protein [Photobacterium rosenbergii]